MEFEKRLEKAIQRGHRASAAQAHARQQQALSEEELRRLHSQYRLELSEHIEQCLSKLARHFPGFQYQTVVGESGWGAKVSRDDFTPTSGGGRDNLFSRMEMVIRPFSQAHALDLGAKGTIRNKEVFNRTHFQRLDEAETETFIEMIDLWTLEYAELFAARS